MNRTAFVPHPTRCVALAFVLAASAFPFTRAGAGETRVWELNGRADFEKGTLQGVALSGDGVLSAGAALTRKGDIEVDGGVWCAVTGPDGALYLGTGNKGAVLRAAPGKDPAPFAQTGGLFVTALAWHGGRLFAAAVPGGRVVAIDAQGKVDTFTRLPDPYPWALLSTPRGLLVGSGPSGLVHVLDERGAPAVAFDGSKGHVLALAAGADGVVYAGTDQGTIWRLEMGEKPTARAVAHVAGVEMRAFVVDGETGALFAAANRCDKLKQADYVRSLAESLESAREGGTADRKQVIEESFQAELFRLDVSTGRLDALATLPKELALSVARVRGGTLIGGGSDGRVHLIDDARRVSVLVDLEEPQAAALVVEAGALTLVGSGNPGRAYAVGPAGADGSRYTSAVHDAGHGATWGRLRWAGSGKLVVETRTGFTPEPGTGWSAWQATGEPDETDGAPVASPPGRYLQLRVAFAADASLEHVALCYRVFNQKPVVESLTVAASGEESSGDGSDKVEGSAPKTDASARALRSTGDPTKALAIAWKASDPDSDALRFALEFRRLGETEWRAIATPKPLEAPTASFNWETTALPDGRYVVRIVASDAGSNPATDALSTERNAERPVLIDHGTPRFEALIQQGARLAGRAIDGTSPVARVEYAWEGGPWQVAPARDGVYDQVAESFEVPLTNVAKGRRALALRATDAAGNMLVERVWVQVE